MKTIAHRGGMGKGMQNTPAGVRLAVEHQVDFVELDVVRDAQGGFHCAHLGWNSKSELCECLAELGADTGLVAHLKGDYAEAYLVRVVEYLAPHLPLEKVVFASHRSGVLRRLRKLMPQVRLARFGLLPAIVALWKQQPWQCCMINQSVLSRWLVKALQQRGYEVIASCVWELRSRRSVKDLGVDGAFVNLHETRPRMGGPQKKNGPSSTAGGAKPASTGLWHGQPSARFLNAPHFPCSLSCICDSSSTPFVAPLPHDSTRQHRESRQDAGMGR